MKFDIDRDAVLDVLAYMVKVAPLHPTLGILKNVHIEAREDGSVVFAASDLMRLISIPVSGVVTEAGAICLPCKTLVDTLDLMTGDTVSFLIDDVKFAAEITCGVDYIKLDGNDGSDFVAITVPSDADPAIVFEGEGSDQLLRALGVVMHAVCEEYTRPVLMSVNVRLNSGVAQFVATDGNRLALAHTEMVYPDLLEGVEVNIPKPLLVSFIALLNRSGSARLQFAGHEFDRLDLLTDEGAMASGSVETTRYPDFSDIVVVVPGSQKTTVVLDRFLRAAKLASVIGQQHDANMVILSVAGEPAVLKITARTTDVGSGAAYVRDVQMQGDSGVKVGVNCLYLLEALKACPADEVEMFLVGKTHSIHLQATVDGLDFHEIIMPVYIRGN